MQFEYDPERLIEEVKKRPGIWDYNDINYKTMVTRHELWNDVVRELLDPNTKISKSELRELVLQLQKKWKSMKDAFQKYVQNPNRSKRPYLYSKQLQFLLKNMNVGVNVESENSNVDLVESSESDEGAKKKKKKRNTWKRKRIQIVKDEEQSADDDNDNDQYDEVPTVSFLNEESYHTPSKVARNSKPDEFAFANVDSKSIDSEDSEKMFLMSLWPHLKSIPEEARLNVKLELMQVLQNASYRHGRMMNESSII